MRVIVRGFEVQTSFVRFEAEVGAGSALWRGATPRPGSAYDVELDVDLALSPTNARRLDAPRACSLRSDAHGLEIVASVEHRDGDGMLFLRLAPDAILMIESRPGSDFAPGDLLRIELPADALELTPIGWPAADGA